jgi:hypothetical protein
MFSNKFDVFKVGIIKITLKNLFIGSNTFFSKFLIPIVSQVFYFLHFSLNLHYFFHLFPNEFETKKNVGWWEGEG